jgi:hypothetical protein
VQKGNIVEQMEICVVSGSAELNNFMGGLDMNDSGMKMFAEPRFYKAASVCDEKTMVDKFKTALEKTGASVAAVFVLGHPESAFVHPTVKMISDGKHFFMLDQFLEGHGIIQSATRPIRTET